MTNDTQALIRRCVERAEGWEWDGVTAKIVIGGQATIYDDIDRPYILDALAAQLVRQVDALKDIRLQSQKECVVIRDNSNKDMREVAGAIGLDRTLNTLRAIDEFYRGQQFVGCSVTGDNKDAVEIGDDS